MIHVRPSIPELKSPECLVHIVCQNLTLLSNLQVNTSLLEYNFNHRLVENRVPDIVYADLPHLLLFLDLYSMTTSKKKGKN